MWGPLEYIVSVMGSTYICTCLLSFIFLGEACFQFVTWFSIGVGLWVFENNWMSGTVISLKRGTFSLAKMLW